MDKEDVVHIYTMEYYSVAAHHRKCRLFWSSQVTKQINKQHKQQPSGKNISEPRFATKKLSKMSAFQEKIITRQERN